MARMEHPEGISLQDQAEQLRNDAGKLPPLLPVKRTPIGLASILRAAVCVLLVTTAMAVVVSRGARHRTAGWIVEAAEFFRGSRRDVAVLEPIRKGPVASQPLEPGKGAEVSGPTGRRTAPQSLPRFVLTPDPSPTPSWVIVPPEEQNAEPAAPAQPISGDVKERAIALLKRDPVVGKLVANQIAGYSYMGSEIVSHEENIVRVLVTARVQGEEKKLTWEVNLDSGQTRPLSYEARKLTP